MIDVNSGNIKDVVSDLSNKTEKKDDPFKGLRWTVKVWPKQRALCYKNLLECLFDMKWASVRNAFYKRGLKTSNPCDVAEYLKEKFKTFNYSEEE